MDEAATRKAFFLWDPTKQPRFVVASSSSRVVKLFSWNASRKQALELNTKADLSDIRTLAWSPASLLSPTLAAATSNGHVSLISFPPPDDQSSRPTPIVSTINPPRPRTTTALAFSPPSTNGHTLPQYLAQGLTKFGRSDTCVWVWDISRTKACSSNPHSSSPFDFASTNPLSPDFSSLDTPINQLIQSDTILDLAWLDPSILAVSSQRSFIRLFDIRVPSQQSTGHAPILTFGTDYTNSNHSSTSHPSSSKASSSSSHLAPQRLVATGLAPDPHSTHRLASYDGGPPLVNPELRGSSSLRDGGSRKSSSGSMGEPSGGPVRIWDRRSPGMEVVLVSNGGPTGAKGAGGLRTGAVGIEWDPEREGRIAVLERGGDLSIFDLVDPLRNEVDGSRTDFGLFAVGEPIRIPAPSPSSTINSFTFAYDDQDCSRPPRAQLATFSAAESGRIDLPKIPIRHPVTFAQDSTLLYGSKISMLSPVPPRPDPLTTATAASFGFTSIQVQPPLRQSPPSFSPDTSSVLHTASSLPNIQPFTSTNVPPPLPIRSSMFETQPRSARALSPLGREPWTAGDVPPTPSAAADDVEGLRGGKGKGNEDRAVLGRTEDKRGRRASRKASTLGNDSPEGKAGKLLGQDISAVMLSRAKAGYGLEDFDRNAIIAEQAGDASLAAMWRWFANYSDRFSASQAKSNAFDFSFQGVHQIFDGFPPSPNYFSSLSGSRSGGATPTAATTAAHDSVNPPIATGAEHHLSRHLTRHPKSTKNRNGSRSRHHLARQTHNQQQAISSAAQSRSSSAGPSTSSTPVPGFRNSPGRQPRNHTHVSSSRSSSASPSHTPGLSTEFKFACASLNAKRSGGRREVRISVSGGTNKLEERICCLGVLGWDLDEDGLEREISRLEDEGRFEYAAFVALMTENGLRRAMQVLQNSEAQNHLIVALFLSNHLELRKEQHRSIDLSASQHIRKMDDPHLQAVWRYGLTGDWEDCLDEAEVPLMDRLAIALRFMPDSAVRTLLNQHRRESLKEGDLSSLPLHGLSSHDTLLLLQAYLNATSDVQTVALLSSHVFPDPSQYPKPRRWLAAYESLLQGGALFEERALLREARIMQAREWGLGGKEVEPMSQVVLRCNYCNKNVNAPPTNDNPSLNGILPSSLPAKLCPHCANNLPNCSICLMSISQPPDRSRDRSVLEAQTPQDTIDWMPIFCLKCRHGGHRKHLSEWFFGSSPSSPSFAPSHAPNHPLYDETQDKLARLRLRASRGRASPDGEDEGDGGYRESDEESSDEDEGNLTCAVAGCSCRCFG